MKRLVARWLAGIVALFGLLLVPVVVVTDSAWATDAARIQSVAINGKQFLPTALQGTEQSYPYMKDAKFTFQVGVLGNTVEGSVYKVTLHLDSPVQEYLSQEVVPGQSITFSGITLKENTSYQATISLEEGRDGGDVSIDQVDFTLKTGVLDNTSPQVESAVPASGANNVSVDSSVDIVLSEELDMSTITGNTVYLEDSNHQKVSASLVRTNAGGKCQITIDPNANLAFGTTYTVRIEGGKVADFAGNTVSAWSRSFTTTADPNKPPLIVSQTPAANATGVSINTSVRLTLNKKINTTTVTPDSFYLRQNSTRVAATSTVVVNDDGTTSVTITPASALSYSTTYTVVAGAGVKDLNNNAMNSTSWSFTTEGSPSVTISSQDPYSGEEDVPVDTDIRFKFSGTVNSSTVNSSNIYIRKSGSSSSVSASVTYASSSRTVTITPSSSLSYGTRYTVYVTSNVKDSAGNNISSVSWSFTTAEEDDDIITSRNPASGATNVAVDTDITFKFTASMKASSIGTSTVYLRKSSSSSNVPASVSYNSSTRVVTLTPDEKLAYDTQYTVYVSSGVKDSAGDGITATSWKFTTIDEDAAGISERDPDAGETDVSVNKAVKIKFKTAMTSSTVNKNNIYLRKSGSASNISASVSYNSSTRTATLTPAAALEYGTKYMVYVTSGVKDADGDALAASSWSFTTEKEKTVYATEYQPASGAIDIPVTTVVICRLSGPVDASTVNGTNAYITDDGGNRVTSTITYSPSINSITIAPVDQLDYNTQYTVSIKNLKDKSGNTLAAMSWKFTTMTTPIGTSTAPVVKLNGKYVNFPDVRPYIKNKRTMLPFRALFETLGAQVAWDGAARKVTATLNGNKVELYIGKTRAYRNGKALTMDVAPEILSGRTMVPLRFASEALGVTVGWDEKTYTVILQK